MQGQTVVHRAVRLLERFAKNPLIEFGELRTMAEEVEIILHRALHRAARLPPWQVAAGKLVRDHAHIERRVVCHQQIRAHEREVDGSVAVHERRLAGQIGIGQSGNLCDLRIEWRPRIKQPHKAVDNLAISEDETRQFNNLRLLGKWRPRHQQTGCFRIENHRNHFVSLRTMNFRSTPKMANVSKITY